MNEKIDFPNPLVRIEKSKTTISISLIRVSQSRNTFFIPRFETWIKIQLFLWFLADLSYKNFCYLTEIWFLVVTNEFQSLSEIQNLNQYCKSYFSWSTQSLPLKVEFLWKSNFLASWSVVCGLLLSATQKSDKTKK